MSLIDRVHTNKPGVTVIVQGLLPDTRGQRDRVNAFNSFLRESVATRSTNGARLL